MNSSQQARYDRETLRLLNVSLAKQRRPTALPILIGKKEVCAILGIKTGNGLMRRVRAGRFPAPLKGREPLPGQSMIDWERIRPKWPTTLVRMAAIGAFGDDTPTTPDGWDDLVNGWRHD